MIAIPQSVHIRTIPIPQSVHIRSIPIPQSVHIRSIPIPQSASLNQVETQVVLGSGSIPMSGTTSLFTSDTAVLSQFKTSLETSLLNSAYAELL